MSNSLIKTATKTTKLPTNFIKLSKKKLKEFEGVYWSDSEKSGRKVYLKNDTLKYSGSEKRECPLVPISKNSFVMIHPFVKPLVIFDDKTKHMTVRVGNNLPGVFNFIQNNLDIKTNGNDMLIGKYYSPELKVMYLISKDDKSDIYLGT